MSYLGLNLDTLYWEIKSLIKNNYGEVNGLNIEEKFEYAKNDILDTFNDIIKQNKEDIIKEVREDLKSL